MKGIREFTKVTDSVELAKGQDTLCGPRAYSITYTNGDPITWVTVAAKANVANTYQIIANPTLDSQATTHNLKLITALTNYPAHAVLEINFNLVVVTPACECNRVVWDAPAV